MKKKKANAPKAEAKAQERLNMMVEVFGLEPSQYETAKIDESLTESLSLLYGSFKNRFGAEGAQKIYRGVAAAKWCADMINNAEDKLETAMEISEKVDSMSNVIYTAIITASTSKKKHVTREQVVMSNLDKMMK